LETPPKGNIIPDIVTWNNSNSVDKTVQTSPQHSVGDKTTQSVQQQTSANHSSEMEAAGGTVTGTDNSSVQNLKDSNMEVDKKAASENDCGSSVEVENCNEEQNCVSEDSLDEDDDIDDDDDADEKCSDEDDLDKTKKVCSTQPRKKPWSKRHGGAKKSSSKTAKSLMKFNTNLVEVSAGSEVAVEVSYTFSCASVMWQVGG